MEASLLLNGVWGLPRKTVDFKLVKYAFYALSCLDVHGSEVRNGKGTVGTGTDKKR